jgi:hypothetical protein
MDLEAVPEAGPEGDLEAVLEAALEGEGEAREVLEVEVVD